jgi:hypothetical protein
VLPSAVVPGRDGDAAAILPRLGQFAPSLALRRPSLEISSPLVATLALATMLACCSLLVLVSTAEPTWLIPASSYGFPGWVAGPLHGLAAALLNAVVNRGGRNYQAMSDGFSVLLIVMTIAYALALAAARTLSMRTIGIAVVVLYLVLFLGPPMQLNDVFNYLGYARLGALHHLNPYTHVIAAEQHDPVYQWTSWHNLASPYGELFTLLTYPLALVSLPLAYWILKSVTVALALAFVWLVYKCACQLGRDPRLAVLIVAVNPIMLLYEVGGFHNDPFMLVPAMAAISLLLARRYRLAGAVLMLAVAIKFTMVLLLPFLLLAAPAGRKRVQMLIGFVLAAIPLAVVSVAAFGLTLPNFAQQSRVVTPFSILNLLGWLIGLGGAAPGLIRFADVVLVAVIAFAIARVVRRRLDWLSAAGWCTVALIVSLAWVMPWYVVWLLPLAAISASARLRTTALALTIFLVLTFMPLTGTAFTNAGINPMASHVGRAAASLSQRLAS